MRVTSEPPTLALFADSEAMLSPEFESALCEDLNTPEAVTHLRRLYSEAVDGVAFAGARLAASGRLLGLFEHDLAAWTGWKPASARIDELAVHRLIKQRLAAREAKNWAESDRIRDELVAMGIQLKDGKDPATGELTTSWEVKR